jgi:hypothetical protein
MIKLGKYLHNKSGRYYEVSGEALHTEDDEILVLYKPLYGDEEKRKRVFARPKKMFLDKVVLEGVEKERFEFVGK